MSSCCLCREVLSSTHRKRKKLHYPGCEIAKEVLQEMDGVSLDKFPTMMDPGAILCHNCVLILNNINKLEEKVTSLKAEIKEKVSALMKTTLKRPLIVNEHPQAAKHLKVGTSSSTATDHADESAAGACLTEPNEQSVNQSPNVKVVISYPSGTQLFDVKTPSRKKCLKRITRRSYCSMASTIVNSPSMCGSVTRNLAAKIRAEMKSLSSDAHDSILRDTVEAVKHFHWDTIMLELMRKVPTLMTLLQQIVKQPAKRKPLLCFIASQLLKSRHQRMGLVQRAISMMLYGNGTAKQVFQNLQPLNVCMSYQRSNEILDSISQDHDIEVQFWADELVKLVDKSFQMETLSENSNSAPSIQPNPPTVLLVDANDSDEDDVEAPPWSPISTISSDEISDDSGSDSEHDESESVTSDHLLHVEDSVQLPEEKKESWFGYKFVGDNVDMNVKPSFQRQEHHTGQSLHCFHGYAVRDRVDLSNCSDTQPPFVTPEPSVLLPSSSDLSVLKDELMVLMSRILTHYMDEFKGEAKKVPAHIPCKHSKEMASKSEVIPLGVLLYNENKLDEMGHILDHYMTLVPTVELEGCHTLPNGSVIDFDDSRFFSILFGGDQLSVARMRGVQALRDTQAKRVDRFEGIVPVIEDWHARMTFMKVIWGRLYKVTSATEKGTMYQLRNLIHRTNVPADPQKNMNTAEDFMLLMLHTHVVAAAKTIQTLNPAKSVCELAKSIMVNFTTIVSDYSDDPNRSIDGVHLYAKELLSLGLLWHGFHDAVREGDGERILRYWRFLLVLFKSTNHHNYAKDAVNLLIQYHYTFSERKKAQLLWSRCINTRGYSGANIPDDLHMEHLNRRLKIVIRSMGANLNPAAIERAGKSIATVHRICQVFEEQTASGLHSEHHPIPCFGKDFNDVLKVLEEERVFMPISASRQHNSFKFSCGLLQKLSNEELKKKIRANIATLN